MRGSPLFSPRSIATRTLGAWRVEALSVLRRLCYWRGEFTESDLAWGLAGRPAELDLGHTLGVGVRARWCEEMGEGRYRSLLFSLNSRRGT